MKFSINSKLKTQGYYDSLNRGHLLASLAMVLLVLIGMSAVDANQPDHIKVESRFKRPALVTTTASKVLNPLFAKTKTTTLAPPTHAQDLANIIPPDFNHRQIVTTVFWVGEPADSSNSFISNTQSAWDGNWQVHYGGVDSNTNRDGYLPAGFTPKENPFYFALPYNDYNDSGARKISASNCPNQVDRVSLAHYSWCKNSWIAIRYNGKTAYAQWEDVGPYQENDVSYVFGSAQPKNTVDTRAGLDVSPAVRDYLGLGDVSKSDWAFVISIAAIPSGPWKQVLTTDLGDAN